MKKINKSLLAMASATLALNCWSQAAAPAATAAPAANPMKVSLIGRAVPDVEKLPAGPQKDLVVYGKALAEQTFAHIGPEVKNKKCVLQAITCHALRATKKALPSPTPCHGLESLLHFHSTVHAKMI